MVSVVSLVYTILSYEITVSNDTINATSIMKEKMIMAYKRDQKKRGRPKTFDRESMIESSMMKYWQDGVLQSSLNEISKLSQVSKPTVYREFGGEDGLIASVVEYYYNKHLIPKLELLNDDRSFEEVLNALIDDTIKPNSTLKGCMIVKMSPYFKTLGKQTQHQLYSVREKMLAGYKSWYERGLLRNEVNPNIDSNTAAYFISVQLTNILNLVTTDDPVHQIKEQALLAFRSLLETE